MATCSPGSSYEDRQGEAHSQCGLTRPREKGTANRGLLQGRTGAAASHTLRYMPGTGGHASFQVGLLSVCTHIRVSVGLAPTHLPIHPHPAVCLTCPHPPTTRASILLEAREHRNWPHTLTSSPRSRSRVCFPHQHHQHHRRPGNRSISGSATHTS